MSEAFTNILSALRRQVGPREKFRPYLLTCVRNSCLQRIRRSKQACKRERSFADDGPMEDERIVENAVAAAAFQSMPDVGSPHCGWRRCNNSTRSRLPSGSMSKSPPPAHWCTAGPSRIHRGVSGPALVSRWPTPCAALAPKLPHRRSWYRRRDGITSGQEPHRPMSGLHVGDRGVGRRQFIVAVSHSSVGAAYGGGTTTAAVSGGGATVAVSGFGLGWLANIAAIAVLSTIHAARQRRRRPRTGLGRGQFHRRVGGSTRIESQTPTPRKPVLPDDGLRDHAVDDNRRRRDVFPARQRFRPGLTPEGPQMSMSHLVYRPTCRPPPEDRDTVDSVAGDITPRDVAAGLCRLTAVDW